MISLLAYIGPGKGMSAGFSLFGGLVSVVDFLLAFLVSVPTLLLCLLALVPFAYLFVLLGRFFLRLGYGVASIH